VYPKFGNWSPDWRQLLLELIVVFVGVTAAFLVENLREERMEMAELRQTSVGIVAELRRYQQGGLRHAKGIREPIKAWRDSDRQGRHVIPELYRIPGAPEPPSAAWDGAVASGVANRFGPSLRYRLGYFYSEFKGVGETNHRHQIFIENEVLPRASAGVQAFYDEKGKFDPHIRARLDLIEEVADDLERLSVIAGELADELEAELNLQSGN
jgi:hypothetical protein